MTEIEAYIARYQLFTADDYLLLAVSGGVDSVVLLDILYHLPHHHLSIAHCNFQLRGKESDGDENFVRRLAESYGIPCFVEQFDTQYFAGKYKLSIQVAARQLRYDWFNKILQSNHLQYLVTAHHQNDNIETILYNLSKGTGIAGLHGILPKNGHIVRPLLCLGKQEILDYAKKKKLKWREDSSNASDKYKRNLIRHHIVPILKQINPNLEGTFQENIEKLSAVERIFARSVADFKNQVLKEQTGAYIIDIQHLKEEFEYEICLYEILKDFGFNYAQNKLIIKSLEGEAGKIFFSDTHCLVRDRKELIISTKSSSPIEPFYFQKTNKQVQSPSFRLSLSIFPKIPDFQFSTHHIHLDFDKLEERLVIRPYTAEDVFYPLGMKGKKKKINDLLSDLKVPIHLKDKTLVLVSNHQIAWVVGYRIDDRFKITENTQNILEIKWELTVP